MNARRGCRFTTVLFIGLVAGGVFTWFGWDYLCGAAHGAAAWVQGEIVLPRTTILSIQQFGGKTYCVDSKIDEELGIRVISTRYNEEYARGFRAACRFLCFNLWVPARTRLYPYVSPESELAFENLYGRGERVVGPISFGSVQVFEAVEVEPSELALSGISPDRRDGKCLSIEVDIGRYKIEQTFSAESHVRWQVTPDGCGRFSISDPDEELIFCLTVSSDGTIVSMLSRIYP